MKPMLASDFDPAKLFKDGPVGLQPKIDGVRSLTTEGCLTGRSLKRHKNLYTTAFFSRAEYAHLDGEMAAYEETAPDLCRRTSSALGTIQGEPFILWHVFDLLTPETIGLPYWSEDGNGRYNILCDHVRWLQSQGVAGHLRVVPMEIVHTPEEYEKYRAQRELEGYEGVIIRKLAGLHKQGRSTVREGGLLRDKQFIKEEAVVISISEGETNLNEAQTNELGNTFRSSHQENKLPNGRVGSLQCTIVADSDLFKAGQVITVSKGEMTDDIARHYFENQSELVGKTIVFKHFPKGVKDKPRFPTWVSIRSEEDMS